MNAKEPEKQWEYMGRTFRTNELRDAFAEGYELGSATVDKYHRTKHIREDTL